MIRVVNKYLKKYNDIPIAAKASLWFMFCSILQKSISLLTTPIFTRIMTTEQYGQFSIYNSWLQIFTIITTLRLNWAVFNKGMSKYKNDRDGYTLTMQTLTTILTTIVLLIYLMFRKQINELTELPTYIMLAIFAELYLIPAIDFWTIRKRYEYIYKPVVFRTVLMTVLNAGLGVIAVLISEDKGVARILSCVIVNVCFGSVLFVYNIRKGKKICSLEYARFALLFNLPLLLHYFSQYILDQFDRIMIQKIVGIAAAGIYSVAYNAGMVMKIVTQSINNALIPWQYDKLEKRKLKELDDTVFLIFILVAICTVAFTSVAPELLMILADIEYQEATYIIPPVALGLFFSFMYTYFANVEFYYDENKFTMFISMIGAGLNICLNYFGIKWYGYIAAAYTTLICYVIFAVAHYIYMEHCVRKKLSVKSVCDSKRLVLLGIVVISLGISMVFLYKKLIIRYVLMLFLCIVGYVKRKVIIDMFGKIRK